MENPISTLHACTSDTANGNRSLSLASPACPNSPCNTGSDDASSHALSAHQCSALGYTANRHARTLPKHRIRPSAPHSPWQSDHMHSTTFSHTHVSQHTLPVVFSSVCTSRRDKRVSPSLSTSAIPILGTITMKTTFLLLLACCTGLTGRLAYSLPLPSSPPREGQGGAGPGIGMTWQQLLEMQSAGRGGTSSVPSHGPATTSTGQGPRNANNSAQRWYGNQHTRATMPQLWDNDPSVRAGEPFGFTRPGTNSETALQDLNRFNLQSETKEQMEGQKEKPKK